jgi:hypothetical protein
MNNFPEVTFMLYSLNLPMRSAKGDPDIETFNTRDPDTDEIEKGEG